MALFEQSIGKSYGYRSRITSFIDFAVQERVLGAIGTESATKPANAKHSDNLADPVKPFTKPRRRCMHR